MFVSPRFRKQLFVLWEPREFGECGDKSAFGDVFDTCNKDPVWSGVPKRRFVRKGYQSLDFPHFATFMHTL